jgi:hypothetical protein
VFCTRWSEACSAHDGVKRDLPRDDQLVAVTSEIGVLTDWCIECRFTDGRMLEVDANVR